MLIKNETCVICHPIFFQFISSSFVQMTINFSLLRKKREKSTQETLFCVISFNLIQCIKSEDQYTPFPNKFKTLFHSQIFLPFFGFFVFVRGRSKIVICDKRRKIGLRYRSAPLCVILMPINAECRLKNKVQGPEKFVNLKMLMGS